MAAKLNIAWYDLFKQVWRRLSSHYCVVPTRLCRLTWMCDQFVKSVSFLPAQSLSLCVSGFCQWIGAPFIKPSTLGNTTVLAWQFERQLTFVNIRDEQVFHLVSCLELYRKTAIIGEAELLCSTD